ncbi:hypothetical protein [Methanorbis furvi]|uniref:Uncharacterized protein n=1 Tax=Methanorbis furvi TaxID=3028299 RepID=A0AAE4SCE7_9EURY|nr:hypothetical protein [Methanocorpusculaceae archaeon Ag1]
MMVPRLLSILLVIVLVVVSVGYLTGAIGEGYGDSGNVFSFLSPTSSPTPLPTRVSVTPSVTSTPTAVPTWDTIPISSQVNEIVTFTPTVTMTAAVPTMNDVTPAYVVHMDDTMQYNSSTERMFELDVVEVPFVLYFSFNPGKVKKMYLTKDATSANTVSYSSWNPATGKYGSWSETESRYSVKSTDVIDPNAWFRIDVIRVYDDPKQYADAVQLGGGKEKLAEKKLLYGDNGIIVKQDGYARGYSSEVEKELKLFSSGHYIIKVTGNQIVANIQMLSP